MLGGPGRFGPGGRRRRRPGLGQAFLGDELATAAKYLGLDESDLRTNLQNGSRLADIAKAQNKDLAGLAAGDPRHREGRPRQGVADKELTQSQADDILANLKSHIANVANGTLRFRGPVVRSQGGLRLAGPHFGAGRSSRPRRRTWG